MAVIVLLLAGYLLNCIAPLRLTNDTVRYFTIKEQLEGSWPSEFSTKPDFLPHGYVWFLSALTRIGLLRSPVVIVIHLGYLLGALFFVRRLFGDAVKGSHLFLFVLLNWTSVKYTLIPLSETQFLFLTTGALYGYLEFERTKSWLHLCLAVACCAGAIFTRTAGIILPLALLVSFVFNRRKPWLAALRAHKWMAIPALIIFLGLVYAAYAIRDNAYFTYFSGPFSASPVQYLAGNFWKQLVYWGELFVNMPWSKTTSWVPATMGAMLFRLIAIVFLALVLYRMGSRRFAIPAVVRIYLLFYLMLIFSWPFFDARFWFPILPLVAGVLLTKPPPSGRSALIAGNVYKVIYVVVGIVALGYYCRLSLNKSEFARKHDAGKWQREYELHFSGRPPADSTINEKALYILNKYD